MGKDMVPKRIFFTKGVGKHRERLTSFELALRDAGIAAQNLVRVSSIFPPNCKLLARKEGVKYLHPGEVVFAVVAENSTREPHRLLASSIGVAIPADRNTYGYLSEHHSFGETEDAAGEYAEELAAEMLATTLNVEFDPDRSWDEKKQIYRLSNKIVRTANVTQSAVGDKRALWTTVIASAVLIFDVVESARVDGKPRIVHQAYLGTAEKLAELVRDRTAPVPLAATTREFGLPAALWAAAQQTGVWDLLQSLWPTRRSGPSPAHYLLLAAIHRICRPGPKTEVADWYRSSILSTLWEFPPNALLRKHSGTRLNRSCRKAQKRSPRPTIPWSKPSCVCWEYGKRNNW